MYLDKRVRSPTSRTATILKFNMSRLFRKRKKDKQQQQRQILRKIDKMSTQFNQSINQSTLFKCRKTA